MPRFSISVFDNDYRALSHYDEHDFKDESAAKEWCRTNSWDGISYGVSGEIARPDDSPDDNPSKA